MSKWKVPEGFTLTKIDGWHTKANGARIRPTEDPANVRLMDDGAVFVFQYNDDEPYVWANNADSPQRGDNPVVEGWKPNGRMVPIKDGWHPPVYCLHAGGEHKGLVEAPHDDGKGESN